MNTLHQMAWGYPFAPPVAGWRPDAPEQWCPFGPVPLQDLLPYYEHLRPCAPPRYSSAHGECPFAVLPSHRGDAGSTGGIAPPVAHRSVRESRDSYGSCQPFPCRVSTARRRRERRAPPSLLVGTAPLVLAHPLHSLLITRSSSLLRDDPPPPCASILSPFVDSTYRVFSSHHPESSHVP
jgi:hypothetical protein